MPELWFPGFTENREFTRERSYRILGVHSGEICIREYHDHGEQERKSFHCTKIFLK